MKDIIILTLIWMVLGLSFFFIAVKMTDKIKSKTTREASKIIMIALLIGIVMLILQ